MADSARLLQAGGWAGEGQDRILGSRLWPGPARRGSSRGVLQYTDHPTVSLSCSLSVSAFHMKMKKEQVCHLPTKSLRQGLRSGRPGYSRNSRQRVDPSSRLLLHLGSGSSWLPSEARRSDGSPPEPERREGLWRGHAPGRQPAWIPWPACRL